MAKKQAAKAKPAQQEDVSPRILSAYRDLKAKQGGLGAVPIGQLIQHSGVPKEAVHAFLLEQARAGNADLHPTTLLPQDLPAAHREAALQVPGRREPAINTTIREPVQRFQGGGQVQPQKQNTTGAKGSYVTDAQGNQVWQPKAQLSSDWYQQHMPSKIAQQQADQLGVTTDQLYQLLGQSGSGGASWNYMGTNPQTQGGAESFVGNPTYNTLQQQVQAAKANQILYPYPQQQGAPQQPQQPQLAPPQPMPTVPITPLTPTAQPLAAPPPAPGMNVPQGNAAVAAPLFSMGQQAQMPQGQLPQAQNPLIGQPAQPQQFQSGGQVQQLNQPKDPNAVNASDPAWWGLGLGGMTGPQLEQLYKTTGQTAPASNAPGAQSAAVGAYYQPYFLGAAALNMPAVINLPPSNQFTNQKGGVATQPGGTFIGSQTPQVPGSMSWSQLAQNAGLSQNDIAEYQKTGMSPDQVGQKLGIQTAPWLTNPSVFAKAPMPTMGQPVGWTGSQTAPLTAATPANAAQMPQMNIQPAAQAQLPPGANVAAAQGPPTDKIHAMLTPGEFVMNQGATRMFGPQLAQMNQMAAPMAPGSVMGGQAAQGARTALATGPQMSSGFAEGFQHGFAGLPPKVTAPTQKAQGGGLVMQTGGYVMPQQPTAQSSEEQYGQAIRNYLASTLTGRNPGITGAEITSGIGGPDPTPTKPYMQAGGYVTPNLDQQLQVQRFAGGGQVEDPAWNAWAASTGPQTELPPITVQGTAPSQRSSHATGAKRQDARPQQQPTATQLTQPQPQYYQSFGYSSGYPGSYQPPQQAQQPAQASDPNFLQRAGQTIGHFFTGSLGQHGDPDPDAPYLRAAGIRQYAGGGLVPEQPSQMSQPQQGTQSSSAPQGAQSELSNFTRHLSTQPSFGGGAPGAPAAPASGLSGGVDYRNTRFDPDPDTPYLQAAGMGGAGGLSGQQRMNIAGGIQSGFNQAAQAIAQSAPPWQWIPAGPWSNPQQYQGQEQQQAQQASQLSAQRSV